MYRYSILCFALLLSSCAYNLSSYLKPKSDTPIVYRYTFVKPDNPFYKRLDSMVGNTGKSDSVTGEIVVIYRTIKINGKRVYFAIEPKDTVADNFSIGSTHFLNAAMIFSKNSVLLASIHKKSDLQKLREEDFNQIIPLKVKLSDTLTVIDKTIRNSEKKLLMYGFKKEDLIVSGQKLKNCMSLVITEKWPESASSGKVWLHKKYGVVKWLRVTGRIDERKF